MKINSIEELLPSYFANELNLEEREKVEQWKEATEVNRQIFADSLRVWEGMELLGKMKKYNPEKAIRNVNSKIDKKQKNRIFEVFQKVAAVLFFPLMIASLYFLVEKSKQPEQPVTWHTLETPSGMRSEFVLPDGSKVFLNANTRLSYPVQFENTIREVCLTGQAYFEVAENKDKPFVVKTGRVNIEVTGTEFLANNYPNEKLTEIVLVKGGINLFQGDYFNSKKDIVQMKSGQKATWYDGNKEMEIKEVDTKKFQAWKDGVLIFREESMSEVVLGLNRWFNVDIQLSGPELKDYVYTATFEDETLIQVLELLKMSAPIDYKIKKRERKADTTFSKMEVEIIQKRN